VRTATVRAVGDVLCLFLNNERFKQFEIIAPEVHGESFNLRILERTTNMLQYMPLFERFMVLCTDDENIKAYKRNKMTQLTGLLQYDSKRVGQVIFREGDVGDCMYILLKGTAIVTTNMSHGTVILSQLEKGAYFGEIALMHPTVRSATVTATSSCVLLSLSRKNFKTRFLQIAPECYSELLAGVGIRKTRVIENSPFVRDEVNEKKPWSNLGLLGNMCEFEAHHAHTVIFKHDDIADKFYVLVSGIVEVEIPMFDQLTGTKKITHHTLERGDYFGEISLLKHCNRAATVTCTSKCVLLTLRKDNFDIFTLKLAKEVRVLLESRIHKMDESFEYSYSKQRRRLSAMHSTKKQSNSRRNRRALSNSMYGPIMNENSLLAMPRDFQHVFVNDENKKRSIFDGAARRNSAARPTQMKINFDGVEAEHAGGGGGAGAGSATAAAAAAASTLESKAP
jgi:CRP-like cAMP-binding protein